MCSGNANKTGSSQPRRPGSTSGLLTPAAAGGARSRSLSTSIQQPRSHSGSRDPLTGTGNTIQRARFPLGITQPGSNNSASYTTVDRPSGSIVLQTPSEGSLNEPIMAGVHRQRADSDDGYDVTQSLSPSQTKKLKLYVDHVAEKTGCPWEVLHEFIDVSIVQS